MQRMKIASVPESAMTLTAHPTFFSHHFQTPKCEHYFGQPAQVLRDSLNKLLPVSHLRMDVHKTALSIMVNTLFLK